PCPRLPTPSPPTPPRSRSPRRKTPGCATTTKPSGPASSDSLFSLFVFSVSLCLCGSLKEQDMTEPIRHRIKGHRKVRAGDLVPHELNYRLHPEVQKAALESLYQQ